MNKTQIVLQELGLAIKQSLKFLDTLGFESENASMFSVCQSDKVNRPVIIPDAIKMMDNPTIGQWLAIHFFPNKDMLKHIASYICPMVFRQEYFNVTPDFSPSTLPYCTAYMTFRPDNYLVSTGFTIFRPIVNKFTARALFSMPKSAFSALLQFLFTMRMVILTIIFFSIHSLIVTQNTYSCKEVV